MFSALAATLTLLTLLFPRDALLTDLDQSSKSRLAK
jgi:hypothetical protein